MDIFSKNQTATHIALNFVPGGDGQVALSIIGPGGQTLETVSVPKEDIWIRQSDYETKQRERRNQEEKNRTQKQAAKQEITDTADAKKREIDANNDLTTASSAAMMVTAATSAFLGLGLVGRRRRKKNKKA